MSKPKKPVLVPLEDEPNIPDPAEAPVVMDARHLPAGETTLASKKRNSGGLGRWLFGLFVSVLAFFLSVAVWGFTAALFSKHSILGWGFSALLCALGAAAILAIFREIRAILRLQKIHDLRVSGAEALPQKKSRKGAKCFAADCKTLQQSSRTQLAHRAA